MNYPATDYINWLPTGDERQRRGVRVIMACFYWLVGANRNRLEAAAAELKSSSRRDDHWSFVLADVFQMPCWSMCGQRGSGTGQFVYAESFRLKVVARK